MKVLEKFYIAANNFILVKQTKNICMRIKKNHVTSEPQNTVTLYNLLLLNTHFSLINFDNIKGFQLDMQIVKLYWKLP